MVQPTTRRRFLTCTLSATAMARFACACRAAEAIGAATPKLETVERQATALGTTVSITAMHGEPRVAAAAIERAFSELDRIEDLMSLYRPESQLCRLNRHGRLDEPHPYLVEVLTASAALSRRTGGAFDVTIQPLWRLYRDAQRRQATPSADEIAAARARIDWRSVEVSGASIRLARPGTQVTLNGIAQGFAADRVSAVLRESGIAFALVNTGEIGALGGKGESEPWTIGIQHPRRADAYVSLARLQGRCLATSGDYESAFTPDFRSHHLLDPRTGLSPPELSSVSIAARSGLEADALSTAVFVLGAGDGLELVRLTPGADALLVLKDGTVQVTAGFPQGLSS